MVNVKGVEDVALLIGTEANKSFLIEAGLVSHADDLRSATPNDLIIAVKGVSEETLNDALEYCSEILEKGFELTEATHNSARTMDVALTMMPNANLAFLSIPGAYVKREGLKALQKNLNLFIFSSNVPIEDEIELKQLGSERGLLVMGPDCGTSILNGVGLGFANRVRHGPIGVVGASGTGIQEITTLIHRYGLGISHAIGTGSNDVSDRIGAITMNEGLKRLEEDNATKVIVIVTKPPGPIAEERILETVGRGKKPIVVNFLGQDRARIDVSGGVYAKTLEDAAHEAARLCGLRKFSDNSRSREAATDLKSSLSKDQKFIRGVFSGGTFAVESSMLIHERLGRVHSNTSYQKSLPLKTAYQSIEHTCVDLGAEEYTLGRPHPMIEPLMRTERILKEASDPQTAVLLLDCVLGYGSHENPGAIISSQIKEARSIAAKAGRNLPVVASICGTDDDQQDRRAQTRTLEEAGALLMDSNAQATIAAISIAAETK
jgi:FdrA protein